MLPEERDPAHQRRLALAMFETNLEKIMRVAQRSDASVLFLTQSKNYADWPVVGDLRDPIAARAVEHHQLEESGQQWQSFLGALKARKQRQ